MFNNTIFMWRLKRRIKKLKKTMNDAWYVKPNPRFSTLINKYRVYWWNVIDIIRFIDGPFDNLLDAGFYIHASMSVRYDLYGNKEVDAYKLAKNWLHYLSGCNGLGKFDKAMSSGYGLRKMTNYSEMIIKSINEQDNTKRHNNNVQIMWELFSSSTGKEKPKNNFLYLDLAADILYEVTLLMIDIEGDDNEP